MVSDISAYGDARRDADVLDLGEERWKFRGFRQARRPSQIIENKDQKDMIPVKYSSTSKKRFRPT